jgi:hypothetical protein
MLISFRPLIQPNSANDSTSGINNLPVISQNVVIFGGYAIITGFKYGFVVITANKTKTYCHPITNYREDPYSLS